MKTLYTAHASAIGGRNGQAKTDDEKLMLTISPPGGAGNGTNPEQLFACGYAACFGSAVDFVAKQQKLATGEITVSSEVNLHQDEGGFSLSVTLDVSLPDLDAAAAQKLVQEAHKVCPYSKATRGNIQVTLKANGGALAQAA